MPASCRPYPSLRTKVDEYWSARLRGFRQHPESGSGHLLTVRGTYVAIYRIASRSAHAQPESLADCSQLDTYPRVVDFEHDEKTIWTALSVPLFAMSLLVSHHRFVWPDDETVQQINDGLLHDVDAEAVD